jgi:NitT/TauT family transport system substrate-binding protein
MPMTQNRRSFLVTTASVGAAGFLPSFAGESPLETTAVRIYNKGPGICIAPQYVAEKLLRAEGFTDVGYVEAGGDAVEALASGEVDISIAYAPRFVMAIDRRQPITLLAGVMVGCFELFANESVRSIGELKGKSVGVQAVGDTPFVLLTLMAAQVGLDPKDIHWVTDPSVKPFDLFVQGKIDAFLGFPPEPQDLRARHVGHVIVNTSVDRPWSQYFCCLLGANTNYVRKYPVATKRVVRAILKSTDLCATDPGRVAQQLVDGGFTPRYDYALQTLTENPYDRWREYDAEDTVRFYSLRLRDADFIKSNPQKIIAEGTDWRFLSDLKRELKG